MRRLVLAVSLLLLTLTTCTASMRVHMLSGSEEYKSEESLKMWAKHLETKFGIQSTFTHGTDRSKSVEGLERLEQADVLIIFCRRWELEGKQAALVRQSIKSGKPILAIRTASHAFEFYPEFDKEVLGGDYQGHGKDVEHMEMVPCSGNLDHPVLESISKWERTGKVYKNPDLAEDVKVLLSANFADRNEPLAWTRINGQQRVFYTAMGYPHDFANETFIALLDNALLWVFDPQNGEASGTEKDTN